MHAIVGRQFLLSSEALNEELVGVTAKRTDAKAEPVGVAEELRRELRLVSR